MPSEFQFKEPPLLSEFQKAVRRGVWIFSGIAHCSAARKVKLLRHCYRLAINKTNRYESQENIDAKYISFTINKHHLGIIKNTFITRSRARANMQICQMQIYAWQAANFESLKAAKL